MVGRATEPAPRQVARSARGSGLADRGYGATVSCFTDLRTLMRVLESGRWPWITAAIFTNVAYFFAYALLYRLGFAVVGVTKSTWSLVPVMFAGLFVNLMVPTGAGGAGCSLTSRSPRPGRWTCDGRGDPRLLPDLLTVVPFVAWGMMSLVQGRRCSHSGSCSLPRHSSRVGLACRADRAVALEASECAPLVGLDVSRAPARASMDPRAWPGGRLARSHGGRFRRRCRCDRGKPGRLALSGIVRICIHLLSAFGLWLFIRGFGAVFPIGALIAAFALGIVLLVIAVIFFRSSAPLARSVHDCDVQIGAGVAAGPAVAATLSFAVSHLCCRCCSAFHSRGASVCAVAVHSTRVAQSPEAARFVRACCDLGSVCAGPRYR